MAEQEMDHWVAALTAKTSKLGLTARTHVVEEETPLLQLHHGLCAHRRTHVCPCTYTLKMFYFIKFFSKTVDQTLQGKIEAENVCRKARKV